MPVGRPSYRWIDREEENLLQLKASNCRKGALDRERWKILISEAKTCFGSQIELKNRMSSEWGQGHPAFKKKPA
ncbi:unnamed protein product [Pieris macdunnoughi]|uniref:Uncharacterized protein n=1 Tax=Pieris macdunnoughi TaxID=345717 RepID=A0A821V8K1_9NEOP|nr:unnamed protein product [Pieris macdunnoughi]